MKFFIFGMMLKLTSYAQKQTKKIREPDYSDSLKYASANAYPNSFYINYVNKTASRVEIVC